MMLWFKGARLIFKLGLTVALGVFLSLNPGLVSFKWFGYAIELPVAIFLLGLLILIASLLSLHSLWRKLWRIPENYFHFIQKRREQKGEKLIIEALTSIAAQQTEEAFHSSELAKALLPKHPLALFVAGQAAYLGNNLDKAKIYFESMNKEPNLRFLGLRGLILQAREEKEWIKLEGFLKQALRLRPDSPWVHEQILENQIRLVETGHANAIETENIHRFIDKETFNAHQSIIFWLKAQKVKDHSEEYTRLISKAHGLKPDNPFIASSLAMAYHRSQHQSKAQKILKNAYVFQPHRELASCWLKIHPNLKPLESYKGLESLTGSHPHHSETLWVMAQAAFEAQLWGQAQQYLHELHNQYGDTQEVCYMIAQLEEIQHPQNRDIIRSWWRRAMASGPEKHWICQKCDYHHYQWKPICGQCNEINRFQWYGFHDQSKNDLKVLSESPKKELTII